MIKGNPDNLIKTLCINEIHLPAPFKVGMGQSGNLPKSPFEGGQGGCYNPENLINLTKIVVQTKAPLNPPEGGKTLLLRRGWGRRNHGSDKINENFN